MLYYYKTMGVISITQHLMWTIFVDSDEEKKDEYLGSRISSKSFLEIMEEAIKTFMNFLKADRENHFRLFTRLFRIKNPRTTTIDPTHLVLLKKVNHKVRTSICQKLL